MKRIDNLFEELFVKLGLSASEGKRKAREIFDVPVIKSGHNYDAVRHLENMIGVNLVGELLMVYRQHSVWSATEERKRGRELNQGWGNYNGANSQGNGGFYNGASGLRSCLLS